MFLLNRCGWWFSGWMRLRPVSLSFFSSSISLSLPPRGWIRLLNSGLKWRVGRAEPVALLMTTLEGCRTWREWGERGGFLSFWKSFYASFLLSPSLKNNPSTRPLPFLSPYSPFISFSQWNKSFSCHPNGISPPRSWPPSCSCLLSILQFLSFFGGRCLCFVRMKSFREAKLWINEE